MSVTAMTDADIAAMLSKLPIYERWLNQPLPGSIELAVNHLDEQELMTLAAEALRRLTEISS